MQLSLQLVVCNGVLVYIYHIVGGQSKASVIDISAYSFGQGQTAFQVDLKVVQVWYYLKTGWSCKGFYGCVCLIRCQNISNKT